MMVYNGRYYRGVGISAIVYENLLVIPLPKTIPEKPLILMRGEIYMSFDHLKRSIAYRKKREKHTRRRERLPGQ